MCRKVEESPIVELSMAYHSVNLGCCYVHCYEEDENKQLKKMVVSHFFVI